MCLMKLSPIMMILFIPFLVSTWQASFSKYSVEFVNHRRWEGVQICLSWQWAGLSWSIAQTFVALVSVPPTKSIPEKGKMMRKPVHNLISKNKIWSIEVNSEVDGKFCGAITDENYSRSRWYGEVIKILWRFWEICWSQLWLAYTSAKYSNNSIQIFCR